MEIPTLVVALVAITTTLVILLHDENVRIPIRVFALSTGSQFILYAIFTLIHIDATTRQYMARLNLIAINAALVIILMSARIKHGKR